MGHERWFRGQHDGQNRPFDWRALAKQHSVPEKVARVLFERAQQQGHGVAPGRVQEIYLALLADARREALRPSPGKVTRTMRLEAERAGEKHRNTRVSRFTGQPIAPGQVTLTSYLARPARDPQVRDRSPEVGDNRARLEAKREAFERPSVTTQHAVDEFERTLDALLGTGTATSQEPWADDEAVAEAWTEDEAAEEVWAGEEPWTGASSEEPWPDEEEAFDRTVEHLPEATRARMERAFGQDFDEVVIYPDSPEATGATHALTRGNEIHFRAGAFEPGTAAGDWLIAHELAHVVQQTARPGQGAGRRALESEADLAASAILAGRSAAVSLGASMGAALAFSDSEDHDVDTDEKDAPAPASAEAAGSADQAMAPAADAAAAADTAATTGATADLTTSGMDEKAAVPASETTADTGSEAEDTAAEAPGSEADEGNDAALLAEISAPEPAEAGAAGGAAGGGGGGGEAAPVEAEAPQVSGSPPEQGLGALQGVRPDKIAGALGDVRAAASNEVSEERAALAQDPPQQMSTGDAAAAAPAPGAGAPEVAAGEDTAAAGQPGQTGEPGAGQEPAVAEQAGVANADTPANTNATPPPVAEVRAPAVDNAPADENNARGGLSEADGDRMSDAIARLPVSDPHVNPEPGPAPELTMSEDARASAQARRDELDATMSSAESTAATHIAQPMGEDHIEVALAPETLKAQLTAGDATADAGAAVAGASEALGAAKAEALGDASEGAAIIAQLEKGAEIDAALATAQGQVATERQAHEQRATDERARVDQEIATLKTQSEAEQDQARADARGQVDQARADWQAEVDSETEAARAEAEGEVQTGLADVEAEQTRANSEAQQHIDEGRDQAEAEQAKGEEEAERVKKEKEEESSGGFFGWLASRAKAFFDGIKKAISSVLDAARQAIKRVIETAKRLAVQVIDAARRVVVATIKAVGRALIAIGDRLLAAFPALRERFRATIQGFVDQAVEAVNTLAESLKENVQKALDLLGRGLDAALGLLERGLHAIVDGVNAVVQGAISFAKGVVEALGAFAVLIKDIAGDPGGWLGKLGGAVMDGIRNHLWGALKTAALAWFQSKVMELLGVGGIILEILMEGGIDLGQITNMAWEALQTAIPAALVAVLIEKLVSMIVPAAGAVMAIIEGLQAAWGTVSRIIAAFGAFVAFLKAVKGGGAGPLFANLLAAAAVVVLDFVANWLLRKLASAARKVGAKLKGLAEKFKNRRKGRRSERRRSAADRRRTPDQDRPASDRPDRRSDPRQDRQRRDQERRSERDRRNRERLDRALRELPPRIRSYLGRRGKQGLMFRARLLAWRLQYGLTSLRVVGSGRNVRIVAKVNPSGDVLDLLNEDLREELLRFLRTESEQVLRETRRREMDALRDSDPAATTASPEDIQSFHPTRRQKRPGTAEKRAAIQNNMTTHGVHMHRVEPGTSPAAFMAMMRETRQGGPGSMRQVVFGQSGMAKAPQAFLGEQKHVALRSGGRMRQSSAFRETRRSKAELAMNPNLPLIGQVAPSYQDLANDMKGGQTSFAAVRALLAGQPLGGADAGRTAAAATLMLGSEGMRSPTALPFFAMSEDLEQGGFTGKELLANTSDNGGPLHPMAHPGGGTRTAELDGVLAQRHRERRRGGQPQTALDPEHQKQIELEIRMIRTWLNTSFSDTYFESASDARSALEAVKAEIRARLRRTTNT